MTPPPTPPSIAGLARALRDGDVTAVELLERSLDRINQADGELNAFRVLSPERARLEAKSADRLLQSDPRAGPLVGIPYAVKDLFDVAGLPTTAGFSGLANNVADDDARAVELLSGAGMVLVGKTNTHQFAYGGTGINHDHGTPRNPWSSEPHVPGGSSSGSGVAVAADLVPMALGTDTGGSVRIPASLCGVTGFKTTVGQVSRRGVYPLSRSMDSVGPLCKTVEDAAYVYDCIQGPDVRDDSTRGYGRQDVLTALRDGIGGVRVGLPQSVFFEDVDPGVRDAVLGAARAFEDLGAEVGEIPFNIARRAVELNPAGRVIAAEAYAANRVWVDEHLDELDPVVGPRLVPGRGTSAADYLTNVNAWRQLRAELADDESWDLLLCPTTPMPALPIHVVDADLSTYLKINARYLRNTTIGNILGLCGLSVPCGLSETGLPIGAMVYGRPFREDLVLRAGWAFQDATVWHMRRPKVT